MKTAVLPRDSQHGRTEDKSIVESLSAVSGLDLHLDRDQLLLQFGPGLVYPAREVRHLDDIRSMIEDSVSPGPDPLYAIYMDVYRKEDGPILRDQGLLYGSVLYNRGTMGREYVRSQGHLHSRAGGTGPRYSEVFEFWSGHGFLYLQREAEPEVKRVLLVPVGPGDRVVLPCGWVHLVITTGKDVLAFGAWCARDNTFEYDALRALGGAAYFFHTDGSAVPNPRYRSVAPLEIVPPDTLPDLGIPRNRPLYMSWREHPSVFAFMAHPELARDAWRNL